MNTPSDDRVFRIGEAYLTTFDGTGNEQRGARPGIILQNNTGNRFSPNVIMIPLTTSLKKSEQPTHVLLPADDTGLLRDSMALCENPECISKERVGKYLTTIPDEYMRRIAKAHLLATAAISYIDPDFLVSIWKEAARLNGRAS